MNRKLYPELKSRKFIEPDIIDDGEKLSRIEDASQDFIIANHFLEHCEDPIGTVGAFARVLRPRGAIYMALPDKSQTFDRDRPVTPLQHLIRDHAEGPSWSRVDHFEEYARLVNHQGLEHARQMMQANYSVHYHVWTKKEMLELAAYLEEKYSLSLKDVHENGAEVILILFKSIKDR